MRPIPEGQRTRSKSSMQPKSKSIYALNHPLIFPYQRRDHVVTL